MGTILKLIGLFVVVVVMANMCQDGQQRGTVGSSSPPAYQPVPVAQGQASGNVAHARLLQLPEAERREILRKYLASSGEKCTAVSRTFYQGQSKTQQAFWNIECAGGGTFVLMIEPDAMGTTSVMDCSVLKLMKAGSCFTKF